MPFAPDLHPAPGEEVTEGQRSGWMGERQSCALPWAGSTPWCGKTPSMPFPVAMSHGGLAELLPTVPAGPRLGEQRHQALRLIRNRGRPRGAEALLTRQGLARLQPASELGRSQTPRPGWRLGETHVTLQPLGDVDSPQLQPPLLCGSSFSCRHWARPGSPPLRPQRARNTATGLIFLPTWISQDLPGTVCSARQDRRMAAHLQTVPVLREGDAVSPLCSAPGVQPRRCPRWSVRPRGGGGCGAQHQAHLPLRRQKGSSGAGTRMVLKMGW